MRDSVQLIKERLSILDVVTPYVELHKAGKNYKGKSPFTSEKTPSFFVSPDRGMYYCFSSNQGGDIFTFVEKMEGVDFKGALKILAEKAGVELVREDPKKRTERDAQYALIEDATKFFFKQLEEHKNAEAYVTKRGVLGKTIHTWRIGLAPDAWRSLKEHLLEKKYTEVQILRAGLIKKTEEAKESYDVFRNRIMFPIFDSSGRVVAFSGRTLSKDAETPKYVNSPETELYQKSEILFGYDKAKQGIRQYDFALIVEGQFDLVLAHQAGYTNTVAVSGTALTPHHIALLQRLSNRVVLALDSDRAGIAAVKRASELMLGKGMDVKVVHIEGGKDPADIIQEDAKHFKKMVGESVHVIEFLLIVFREGVKDERAYKLRVREEVLPLLARMPSRIDREHFEGIIADALNTTKDAIHYEVSRIEETSSVQNAYTASEEVEQPSNMPTNETRLQSLTAYLTVMTTLLKDSQKEALEKALTTILAKSVEEILHDMPAEVQSKLMFSFEESLEAIPEQERTLDLSDKLGELHRLTVRAKLKAAKEGVRAAEGAGDTEALEKALGKVAELQKELTEEPYRRDTFT